MLEALIVAKRLPSGEVLLRGVKLAAAPGEAVVLLGPSGTGKTSTLRILLGLDRDFEGGLQNSAKHTGAMFQEPRLLPWLTVGDNIRLVVPKGMAVPDVAELLREVGMPGTEMLHPRQVSLGMARRAALARALAISPDLLVLDEPFASLDPGSATVIAQRLTELRQRGGALVIAMHDIDRAVAMATRLVVLDGRPATVAWQAEIAAGADEVERPLVRAEAIRRFPFLASSVQQPAGDELSVPPQGG